MTISNNRAMAATSNQADHWPHSIVLKRHRPQPMKRWSMVNILARLAAKTQSLACLEALIFDLIAFPSSRFCTEP